MSTSPKISRKEALQELWRRGNLRHKCHTVQKEMYDLYYQSENNSILVWLLGRQSGKSYLFTILALEAALRKPNTIIKLVTDTKLHVRSIFDPHFKDILEDCPEELKPKYYTQQYYYHFPNGSQIQLAGSDNKHYEKLRGQKSELVLVDEAGFCNDLDDMVTSVLLPTTTHTGGKIILASTPSADSNHPFLKFIERAEMEKKFVKKTIDDNPLLTPEQKHNIEEKMGGRTSERFRREYLCVDENTLIKTENGYKAIKNIDIGEKVFTHLGNYKPVLNKFLNNLGDRKVYKVSHSNNMGAICTEGHQLLITEISKHTKKAVDNWKKVEDIQIKKNRTRRTYFKVPIDTEILNDNIYNPDLAYLIGWHLAEGHLRKNQCVLSLNYKDNITKINELSQKIWGKPYRLTTRSQGCNQWTLNSKVIYNFLKQFGEGAKNKFIPNSLKKSTIEIRKNLLLGLFSGDGYYNLDAHRAGYASISLKLITDISDILNSLEIPHQIVKSKEEGDSIILGRKIYINNCYNINIFGKNFEKFMSIIHDTEVPRIARPGRSFIKDGYLYSRIHKIEQIEYNKPIVYDIEVQDDHSYVSLHSTMHNCEIIRDANLTVLPEFDDNLVKEIVKPWDIPAYRDNYVGMDLGFKDLTALVFGYYDFKSDKIIIEEELVFNFQDKDNNIEKLTKDIGKIETKLWFNPLTNEVKKPFSRVSDINPIVIQEITHYSRKNGITPTIYFTNAKKDDKKAAINTLRTLLVAKKIIINPKCENLIRHLKNVKWKNLNSSNEFDRSPDEGHYDLVDALLYMIRSIAFGRNPYPPGYDLNLRQVDAHFTQNYSNNTQVDVFRKIFNIKRK